MLTGWNRTYEWTSAGQAKRITDGNTGNESYFDYGPDGQRIRQIAHWALLKRTTLYVGGIYEKSVEDDWDPLTPEAPVTRHRCYLGDFAILIQEERENEPTITKTHYLHRDHLDSIELITDQAGAVVEENSFDAWGKRREASDWSDRPAVDVLSTNPGKETRGFTGHEMLDNVGLVHMNGRVYDPLFGRFISADPFVQSPTNTQNFNRYSYVLNNPLSLTDPSGFFFSSIFKAIGNAFKSVVNFHKELLNTHIGHLKKAAKWVSKNWRVLVVAAAVVVVAVAPYAAPALGAAISASTTAAVAYGAVGGAVIGATQGAVYGGTPEAIIKGALIGAITGAITAGVGHAIPWAEGVTGIAKVGQAAGKGILHGLVQGARSVAEGGDFVSGFAGGAVGSFMGALEIGGSFDGAGGLLLRTSIAAAVGGTAARIGGGDFASGAVSAAFVHLFNDEIGKLFENRIAGERDRLITRAREWNNTSPGWWPWNQCGPQAEALMIELMAEGNVAHWTVDIVSGDRRWWRSTGALGNTHNVVVVRASDTARAAGFGDFVLDGFKHWGELNSPMVDVVRPRDWRRHYPIPALRKGKIANDIPMYDPESSKTFR